MPKFLRYSDNGHSQNAYSHNGYSHSAAYTAGFNRDAEAQWLVNMRTRWAYDYAVWRQINGPTGIFASFGGVGGYGYGNGYGLGRATDSDTASEPATATQEDTETTAIADDNRRRCCDRPDTLILLVFLGKLARPMRNPMRNRKKVGKKARPRGSRPVHSPREFLATPVQLADIEGGTAGAVARCASFRDRLPDLWRARSSTASETAALKSIHRRSSIR